MMYEYIKSYDTNNTNPEMSKKKRDRRWAAYDYVRSWVGSIKHEPKYQTVWHPSDAMANLLIHFHPRLLVFVSE